jgi:hypothetical protein
VQIKNLSEDNFDNLVFSKECLERLKHATSSSAMLTYVSPLLERTAIILPPSFFEKMHRDQQHVAEFVHVLDFLVQSRFDVCGMKMVLFSNDSAQKLRAILSLDVEVRHSYIRCNHDRPIRRELGHNNIGL